MLSPRFMIQVSVSSMFEASEAEVRRLKEEVLKFIRENPGSLTSDIIANFDNYDPLLILKILRELEEEGRVESRDVRATD